MAETTTPAAGASRASPMHSARSTHSARNAVLLCVAALIAGGLIWYLLGRGGPPPPMRGGGRPTAAVGIAAAELADVPVYVSAIGTVQPVVAATVRPQLAGTLFSIDFREGQRVNKGDLLAQIDPRPYRLALSQAEGTLGRDKAQLAAARGDLARYTQLLQQDSIARQQVDTQKAMVNQLEGTILADEAAVGTARLNLEYTSIRAPVSGKVGLRQADIGNYLTPSDANGIVVITQTAPIDVAFALPQDQLPKIQERLREQPEMAVTARDKAGSAVLGRGTFLTFDNQIDPATGTVRAKARFDNADERLFPNQFVNVELLVDTLSKAITVPVAAVRHGAQGDFIFLLLPDKTAKLSLVATGPSNDGRTVILSGVAPGDTVITEGADRLEDGARVNLPGQGPPPDARGERGPNPGAPTERGPNPDARNERRDSRQR